MNQCCGFGDFVYISGDFILQGFNLIPEAVRLRKQFVCFLTVEHRINDSLSHEHCKSLALFGILCQKGLNLLNTMKRII